MALEVSLQHVRTARGLGACLVANWLQKLLMKCLKDFAARHGTCLSLFHTLVLETCANLGPRPLVYILHLEFDKTMTETSHLLLYPILVLGLFNFFWVPLANYFGKRPVFVFASLLLCVCYIWGACASSFKSLLWSNIIAAVAGSSTEALGAAMVNVSLPFPGIRAPRAQCCNVLRHVLRIGSLLRP